jgi:hypothetical protein
MFLVVLALLLALPFIELWVAIAVADAIGWPLTLLLLMAMSFSGLLLLRRQGTSVWRRANAEMAAGRVPTAQLLDGAMVIVGGVSLMVPGFVTGGVRRTADAAPGPGVAPAAHGRLDGCPCGRDWCGPGACRRSWSTPWWALTAGSDSAAGPWAT